MTVLLNLVGGVALLIWGIRMVRTAVTRGFGADLRRVVAIAAGSRLKAIVAGLGITTLLQSSTATALITASFANRGAITPALSLAILLGADVGTTVVVQIFSQRIEWLSPLLIFLGVVRFLTSERTRQRNLGRAALGLGLILLALQILSAGSQPLASSEAMTIVISHLGNEPLLTILLISGITVLLQSSVAVVLLVAALATSGVISLEQAIVMVLGANLGGAMLPVLATYAMSNEARYAPIANAMVRFTGVAVFAVFVAQSSQLLAGVGLAPATAIAQYHTLFNLIIAVLALPFVEPIVKLVERLLPAQLPSENGASFSNLEEQAYDSPAVALACATRETLKIGDVVREMLHGTIDVLRNDDGILRKEIEALDDEVDTLYESIKLYLARLTREELDSEESARSIEILSFTTNLEHVGDIIDKNLMELAAKKARAKVMFSDVGMQEIESLHSDVVANMELALNVFITGDLDLARRLLAQKTEIRDKELQSTERHFARISEGWTDSIDSSSLHLDILRDLKRINSHLTSVAYPILERADELAESRLRASTPQDALSSVSESGMVRDAAGSTMSSSKGGK